MLKKEDFITKSAKAKSSTINLRHAVISLIFVSAVTIGLGYFAGSQQRQTANSSSQKPATQIVNTPAADSRPLVDKTGPDFDKGYLSYMYEQHTITLAIVETTGKKGIRPELQNHLTRTATGTRARIASIEQLADQLGYQLPKVSPANISELIDNLTRRSGADFEQQFMKDYIAHQILANQAVNLVATATTNTDIKALNEDILLGLTLDIGVMQDMASKFGYDIGSSAAAPGHGAHSAN